VQQLGKDCSCGWFTRLSKRFKGVAKKEYSPPNILKAPVSQVIEHIQLAVTTSVDDRKRHQGLSPSRENPLGWHEPEEYIRAFYTDVENAKSRATICYDCVKDLGSGEVPSCQSKHG
jgi:hypothetical protein